MICEIMASKSVTNVDTRSELAELVKRKAEIAVFVFIYVNMIIMVECYLFPTTLNIK